MLKRQFTVNPFVTSERAKERRRTHTMKPDIQARREGAFTQSITVQAPEWDGGQ